MIIKEKVKEEYFKYNNKWYVNNVLQKAQLHPIIYEDLGCPEV